jgi:hypothetical protein
MDVSDQTRKWATHICALCGLCNSTTVFPPLRWLVTPSRLIARATNTHKQKREKRFQLWSGGSANLYYAYFLEDLHWFQLQLTNRIICDWKSAFVYCARLSISIFRQKKKTEYRISWEIALHFLPSTKHCQQVQRSFQFLKPKKLCPDGPGLTCHLLRLPKLTALAFNGIFAEGLKGGGTGARWVVKGCHDQYTTL